MSRHYWAHQHLLEDFWGRRQNGPHHRRTFQVFGCRIEMTSNDQRVLASADFSAPLYSQAPAQQDAVCRMRWVVREPPQDPGPPPLHPADHIQYTGYDEWINLQFGSWGNCFADLRAGTVTAVLTPQLANQPELIGRGMLNTLINNYLTYNGFAMLHATGLVQKERVLLLMAPHNSGKSTTALRLALSGHFRLLSDSQIYATQTEAGLQLTGFPVGRGKLRQDMLPEFPQLARLLVPEKVRDEIKYVVDLGRLDSNMVCEQAVYPDEVDLYLLKQNGYPETVIRQATLDEAWQAVMMNSLHYDSERAWSDNLSQIEPLIRRARLFHLEIGTNGQDIVDRIMATAP